MFERGGHAGMLFRYHGPDTGNRWLVVRAKGRQHRKRANYKITYRHGLFMENAFYFGQGGRCQNLNSRKPNMARWKHVRALPSKQMLIDLWNAKSFHVDRRIEPKLHFLTIMSFRGCELSQYRWQMEWFCTEQSLCCALDRPLANLQDKPLPI